MRTLVPGGVRVINLPLATILWMAHGVQQDQILNIPDWVRSESFDPLRAFGRFAVRSLAG